jgi:hypothetical protein
MRHRVGDLGSAQRPMLDFRIELRAYRTTIIDSHIHTSAALIPMT